MTTLLTSRLPSAQLPVPATGPRALAGSDGTSAAASAFDAVIVGYAASSKPPAEREAVPADRKPGDGTDAATQSADERAKTALVLKRTRDDALRRHCTLPKSKEEAPGAAPGLNRPEATPTTPGDVSVPIDPALPDGESASFGAPVPVSVLAPGAVPLPVSNLPGVMPDAASTLPGILPVSVSTPPGVAPVSVSTPPGAEPEPAVSTDEAGTMTGTSVPEAAEARPLAPSQPVVLASTSAQTQLDANASGEAVAPNADDPQIPTGARSVDVGAVPAVSTPAAPGTPVTVTGLATASPAPDGAGTKDAGQPGGGDTAPGQSAPETKKVGSISLGQPVVDVPAGPQLQSLVDVTAVVPGTPATPVPGVVPAISSPVPPPAPWAASASPEAGQPAPFAPPPAAQAQVFAAVSPLLRGADGSYGIQLQLHPRDLGAVQVSVEIHHGEISIQLNAPDAAARDALRSGLSDLRQQLESQGLRPGSMEVGSGGANARQPETSWQTAEGNSAPRQGLAPLDLPVASEVPTSSTSLDLRM